MKNRVRKILSYVAERVLTAPVSAQDVEGIVSELIEDGYSLQEINAAFSLIFSLPEFLLVNLPESFSSTNAMRVLSWAERNKLEIDAQGYLWQLLNNDLLTPRELEDLLHSVMELETDSVTVAELMWLFPRVLSDRMKSSLLTGRTLSSHKDKDVQIH
ncbi:MAG: DUF494 domain-containing protein [Firmicutes bacterium]|nr:DUF494 domain-containing protein [Bacillota bacterium]